MMKKLNKKYKFQGLLKVLTGLHIGGNSDSVEIGGIDNPVIKIGTKKNEPYIPGSSLKGKIRSLLETTEGKDLGKSEKARVLFGWPNKEKDIDFSPARVIIRDAYLARNENNDLESKELATAIEEGYLDMPFTESKWENTINRYNAVANPRQMERVPAFSSFNLEIIVNEYEGDIIYDIISDLKSGIKLLENDYLGGSGTRGYGQVKVDISWDDYDSNIVFPNK